MSVKLFAGNPFCMNDIALATVEIGIDGEINPSVQGHVLLLWEEGESENINDFMDEGTITISNPEKCPYYLTAGKMYLPFGSFESSWNGFFPSFACRGSYRYMGQ